MAVPPGAVSFSPRQCRRVHSPPHLLGSKSSRVLSPAQVRTQRLVCVGWLVVTPKKCTESEPYTFIDTTYGQRTMVPLIIPKQRGQSILWHGNTLVLADQSDSSTSICIIAYHPYPGTPCTDEMLLHPTVTYGKDCRIKGGRGGKFTCTVGSAEYRAGTIMQEPG